MDGLQGAWGRSPVAILARPNNVQLEAEDNHTGPFYDAFAGPVAPQYVAPHMAPQPTIPPPYVTNPYTTHHAAPTDPQWASLGDDDRAKNVLHELADVAERTSPNNHAKKRRREDDWDTKPRGYRREDEFDPRLVPREYRRVPTMPNASAARKKMNEARNRWLDALSALKHTERQIGDLQQQMDQQKVELNLADQEVNQVSQDHCNELLQDVCTWNALYWELADFHTRNGHLRIPWKKEEREKNPSIAKLGPWLVQQRKDYRRPKDDPERLEPYRIVALEQLGIDWEPYRTHWFNRFEALKKFKAENGHTRVPYCTGKRKKKKKKDSDEAEEDDSKPRDDDDDTRVTYDSLGVWVKRQRFQHKMLREGIKERAGDMTEERIRLLESIGFEWILRSTEKESWIERYAQLKAYKAKNGNTRVSERENKSLYEWTKSMRNQYNRFVENQSESSLTAEQFHMLKELQIETSLRESKFDQRLADLKEFKEQHGHCMVPSNYPLNPKLSNWCMTQKRHFKMMKEGKQTSLTVEKVNMLIEAGFEFEVTKERKHATKLKKSWDEIYAELVQSKNRGGKKNKQLKTWCEEQRIQYSRLKWGDTATITPEQIEKLNKIDFTWESADSPSKGWDEYFGDLLMHRVTTGDFALVDDKKDLKRWVKEQQLEYCKFSQGIPSLLTMGRIRKLESVAFPLVAKDEDAKDFAPAAAVKPTCRSWEEMFVELLQFKIENAHMQVPHTCVELYQWMAEQRQSKDLFNVGKVRSAVAQERINKLNAVGFPWTGPRAGRKRREQLCSGPSRIHGAPVPLPMMQRPPAVSPVQPAAYPMAPPMVAAWPNYGIVQVPVVAPLPPSVAPQQPPVPTRRPPGHDMLDNPSGVDLSREAAAIVADVNEKTKNMLVPKPPETLVAAASAKTPAVIEPAVGAHTTEQKG